MIKYELAGLFENDSTHKDFIIKGSSGVTLRNSDLYAERFKFVENLNSDTNLRFGSCESSYIEFTCSNNFVSLGKYVDVQIVLNGETTKPFNLGRFYITSDEIKDDRKERTIVAFDKLQKVLNKNCASWYNKLKFPLTLKEFRDSFFSYVGITQRSQTLINDSVSIEKTIDTKELSGLDILTAICELNAAFGHMGRDNTFQYVVLKEIEKGLYPSEFLYPSNNLYPRAEPVNSKIVQSMYMTCTGEEYEVKAIDKLVIKSEENDVGVTIGEGDNIYNIVSNFLIYGKSAHSLEIIGTRIYNEISRIIYTPFAMKAKGNYCREPGDVVMVYGPERAFSTYIINRTCEGIQSLFDSLETTGDEYREEDLTSINNSIIQLRGKSNVLTRTIDETKSEMKDIEKGLSSRIKQTADAIELEVSERKGADTELASSIKQTAESIKAEVVAKKGGETSSFGWNLTATSWTLSANGKKVFVCDKDGISITGSGTFSGTVTATAGKIGGCKITDGLLEIAAARITSGTINAARIPNLDASKITAGTISTARLSADVITAQNWESQKIKAGMIDAGVIDASKITTGSFQAGRVTAGTVNGRAVSWQRFEYMTGLNLVAVYDKSGTLTTTQQYPTQQPVGYMVTSIATSHLYSLCQTNA